MPDGLRPRVAYLVSYYPLPSHVFIEREVLGLRRLGLEVDTFSIHRTSRELMMSALMAEEDDRTTALLDERRTLMRIVARLLGRQPRSVVRAAATALRTGERRAKARVYQLFYLAEALILLEQLQQRGIRHVHVHFSNNAADVARLVVALGRAVDGDDAGWRWSMTVHGPTEFEAVERWDLAAKVCSASAVACISDFTRSQLMRLVPPEVWPRLNLVRMSVDLDRYPRVDRAAHDGPVRILTVGRLVAEKGSPVLVEALVSLAEAGVDFEARIIGSGPLHDEVSRALEANGLTGRVIMTGSIGQDELPEHYAWADVFVLPSFQEGLPVVLMEAMASCLPVVTTAIAGIPELVENGVNGIVVPAGRADRVAQALAELASDPARRLRFGDAGRQRIEREFDMDVTSVAQERFLVSATSSRS